MSRATMPGIREFLWSIRSKSVRKRPSSTIFTAGYSVGSA
jgi:hypothetical protein